MAVPTAATGAKLEQLHPDLRVRVQALLLAAPGRVGITSAYRSRARQAELYAGWVARLPGYNPANPPGTSKHEHEQDGRPAARAVDLAWPSAELKRWGHAHGHRFGLHFPITREPWHAESNGRPFPADPDPDDQEDDMTPHQAATLDQLARDVAQLLTEQDMLRRDVRELGDQAGLKVRDRTKLDGVIES